MIRKTAHLLTAAAMLITAAAVVRPAAAQAVAAPVRLLDVPYLPQTVALCGGAAAAMVMRYWGATGIYAETFADLIVPEAGGIRGDDLLEALRARGWEARAFRGDAAFVQHHLAEGRPVIALIEDRPGTFHYVVIVGWAAGRVIAHDPARAPFRVLDEAAFADAWSRAAFWSMLALPRQGARGDVAAPGPEAGAPHPAASRSPCDGMVEEGVRLAIGGDSASARRLFETAADACPASSAPWRELAGLHVLREAWADAEADARRAVRRDRRDQHAWRILATSLFLQGDPDGALAAWNEVGEPVIDLIAIRGLDRTRYATTLQVLHLEPRTALTRPRLDRARRRLAEMPSVQASRVSYRPGEGGRATVDAVVLERPMLPVSRLSLAAVGLRMLTDRELRADVASPTGGGEVWSAAWRWWADRPAIVLGFGAPGPGGGIARVTLFSAQQTFGGEPARVVERRAGGALSLSDWTAGGTRWDLAAGVDRWRSGGRAVSLAVDLQHRLRADRIRLRANATTWVGDVRTATLGLSGGWRSSTVHEGRVLLARAGVDTAGRAAPMSVWPGAGTGQAREVLLRAHPLLDGGIIADGVFGRTLLHAGAEWRQWHQAARRPLRVAPALFLDAARAARTLPPFDDRWHLDAGAGLRLAVPGAGVVRLDLARGLRDGATALSIGWVR